jgi:hypothetical protein
MELIDQIHDLPGCHCSVHGIDEHGISKCIRNYVIYHKIQETMPSAASRVLNY